MKFKHRGVYYEKDRQKWVAYINVSGTRYGYKRFGTFPKAVEYREFLESLSEEEIRRIKHDNYRRKKFNKYSVLGEHTHIFSDKGEYVGVIDTCDIAKAKKFHWALDGKGYCYNAASKSYLHRLIHNITTKKEDWRQVDHINRRKNDNRSSNLRTVSQKENSQNIGIKSNNTSGATGVYFNKRTCKWTAGIKINYKQIHLGTFNTFEEAHEKRKRYKRETSILS